MAFANLCHNSRTLRATNMRGWWVLFLASVCLADECSDISCEVTQNNVCGYDKSNKIHAFFDDDCVMAKCNCRYKAVGSTARFLEQDAGNCSKDPYVSYIDECSPETSSEDPQETETPSIEEIVYPPKDNETLIFGDLMPQDSLEDEDAFTGEEVNGSDILDTSKDDILPILTIVPSKEIDPLEVSEENESGIDQETGPFIPDSERVPPPPPPPFPLELGRLGSMLLHGLAGNLDQNVERKHDPPGQTIIKADVHVNVYVNENMPFPPHHEHHGHRPEEDSEEQSENSSFEENDPVPFEEPGPQHHKHHGHRKQEDSEEQSENSSFEENDPVPFEQPGPQHHKHHGHRPHEDCGEQGVKTTFEVNVPVPVENPDVPILQAEGNVPVPMENPDLPILQAEGNVPLPLTDYGLPIPSAVHQYPTAGSAQSKLDVLAILLTSVLAILWSRY